MKRIVAAMVALGFSGCGEVEQTASYKDGKYRGKPDAKPWDNAPPASGPAAWAQGDHATWANQLRSRNVASQNEHRRIGH